MTLLVYNANYQQPSTTIDEHHPANEPTPAIKTAVEGDNTDQKHQNSDKVMLLSRTLTRRE